ncbi:MAG: DUF1552 domain-containing protein [Myxococcales bacterium]|nr:DUF1552 domain-containing protein [Myxococcales bacterium]MCB9714941.1 DUF1552 domain-containing protein [Myxococcales bacterium]
MSRKFLSRRTMLRGAMGGAAVSLALPPLEAMLSPNGAWADGSEDPPTFGIFFWANGTPWHAGHGAEQGSSGYPDLWTPIGTGAGYTPNELTQPLAAHSVSIATGLEPKTEIPADPPGQGDGHMRGFMVALTSDRPRPEGFDHPSHTLTALRPTLDQYVAKHEQFYGSNVPRFRSLVMGISEARFHDYGHWNAISYNGPDSVNLPVMDPAQLYGLLFDIPADTALLERRVSLLDTVMEDAHDLRARLGAADQVRLDEHLAHLDEIQRRLELSVAACDDPGLPASSGDLIEKTDIMAQLLARGLLCGLTRVFSFMLTSPATTHVFSNLGVPDGMHKTCHDGLWDRVRSITLYQMQAFARFLDVMQGTVDPTGLSLLDRMLVLGTSEYGEGWQHGNKEHPVIFAGRCCGAINPGVHERIPDGNLSMAHVSALRALGIETPSYGFNGGETGEQLSNILA